MNAPTRLTLTGSGGLKLAADAYGDPRDRTVLLFHGGGQTRHSWRGTATTLVAAGWYAVAVDLRGHGASEWSPDQAYELDHFAGDVRRVAEQFDEPVLVGASLGGISALTAIGEADARIASGLVLVDIVVRPEPEGVRRIRDFMRSGIDGFADLDEVAAAIAAYLPQRRRTPNREGLLKNVRKRPDGRWTWHWDPAFFHRVDQEPGEPTAGEFSPQDRLDRAARRIGVPTLVVRGEASDVVTDSAVEEMLRLVPGARSVVVPGAGHMVAGDQNDVFTSAVMDFLENDAKR